MHNATTVAALISRRPPVKAHAGCDVQSLWGADGRAGPRDLGYLPAERHARVHVGAEVDAAHDARLTGLVRQVMEGGRILRNSRVSTPPAAAE